MKYRPAPAAVQAVVLRDHTGSRVLESPQVQGVPADKPELAKEKPKMESNAAAPVMYDPRNTPGQAELFERLGIAADMALAVGGGVLPFSLTLVNENSEWGLGMTLLSSLLVASSIAAVLFMLHKDPAHSWARGWTAALVILCALPSIGIEAFHAFAASHPGTHHIEGRRALVFPLAVFGASILITSYAKVRASRSRSKT